METIVSYLIGKPSGRQLTPADVDAIWAQFEQYEPTQLRYEKAGVHACGTGFLGKLWLVYVIVILEFEVVSRKLNII